jgi:hypothetical protein
MRPPVRSGRVAATCFILAALLLVAQVAHCDVLDALVIGAATADVVTTERALGREGLREGNPLLQTPAARIGAKGAALALTIVVRHELGRRGHKRASKIFGIAVLAVWGGAAVNNVIVAQRRGR